MDKLRVVHGGCFKADYKQTNEGGTNFQLYPNGAGKKEYCNAFSFCFNKEDRQPTMGAMRAPLLCALHTFNWVFTDCPQEQGYVAVEFTRDDNRKFCHYVNNKVTYPLRNAIRECEKIGSSLSGFDSKREFEEVKKHLEPVSNSFDNHYWLGGEAPCTHDCVNPNDHSLYVASWNNGVGINTRFLNEFEHRGMPWVADDKGQPQYVSFRKDEIAFHVHIEFGYAEMFSICGKTAPLKQSDRKRGGVVAPK